MYAAIHLKGFGACPAPYYYAAAAGSNYLNITAGSVGLSTSKTVTIQPSQTTTACTTASLHWGAPANTTSGNPGMPQVYENGFVIINVACT